MIHQNKRIIMTLTRFTEHGLSVGTYAAVNATDGESLYCNIATLFRNVLNSFGTMKKEDFENLTKKEVESIISAIQDELFVLDGFKVEIYYRNYDKLIKKLKVGTAVRLKLELISKLSKLDWGIDMLEHKIPDGSYVLTSFIMDVINIPRVKLVNSYTGSITSKSNISSKFRLKPVLKRPTMKHLFIYGDGLIQPSKDRAKYNKVLKEHGQLKADKEFLNGKK
jgi:hypothetical protein